MKVIIGKEGQQPFPIDGKSVSRHHCEIETDDNGNWTLRDLNSANGTYILDEDRGVLRPVADEKIKPTTLICLATDSAAGCTFYAYNVLHPDDYAPILYHLREREEQFDAMEAKLDYRVKLQKRIVFILNVLIMVVSFMPFMEQWPETRLWLLRIVPLASSGFASFYDASGQRKALKAMRNTCYCPNPACHHKLTADDVRRGEHSKCKTIFV